METTIEKVECDFCHNGFTLDALYNVEYLDGLTNVLCEGCLDDADGVLWAWRSTD